MVRTIYQPENGDFSNLCHDLARKVFYPKLFNVDPQKIIYEESTLLNESARGRILDGEMGVDRIVQCEVSGLNGHTTFTIQERFRRPKFYEYKDITITEWNHASGTPSELSKINAGIFVYGYANESVTGFLEVVAIDTAALLLAVTAANIKYDRRSNKKRQTFLTFSFGELLRKNLIMYQFPSDWRPPDNVSKRRPTP